MSGERLPGVGAKSDNMAPTKISMGLRVVGQGIDTLVLNVYGELLPGVVAALDEAKKQAQGSDDDWAPSPLPAFDGTVPAIHASGVKYYEWRCVSEDLTLTLARPGRSSRPAAVLRVSAKTLWRLGDGGHVAGRLAWAYLAPLFAGEGYRVQLGRVDLARDFQGWEVSAGDLAGVVMRADGKDVYYGRGDRVESVAAGRSNRLRANIYDKRLQARKKAIGWLEATWEGVAGYDPAAAVWRSEFQFGREFLRDCAVETLEELQVAQERLWAYAAAWFSFRVPGVASCTATVGRSCRRGRRSRCGARSSPCRSRGCGWCGRQSSAWRRVRLATLLR